MTKKPPAALMSYAHSDDIDRQLTTFRERLSQEVKVQTGVEFPIFQDIKDIHWGQTWQQRINDSLDEITFLIPIITPSFFSSDACRAELKRFVDRETRLGRNDLILPVYFVETDLLSDPELHATDELAEVIASRQYVDWRELRFELFTNPQVRKALAQLASQLRDALPRVQTARKAPGKTSATSHVQTTAPTKDESGDPPTEGPTAKQEPPTRIVDPWHRGDFTTIAEAIKSVDPGTRILVRTGLYLESLVINKPLEIIGDGEPGEVVIQAEDLRVILFQTTMGRIVNLTLRQVGGDMNYCVDIAQGRLELEDCDITSQGSACVAIHGGADPRLRRNRIHDSKHGSGVFVYENAQGTFEDNDIFRNHLSAIEIKTSSNPMLRGNRIHHNKGGVNVHDAGQGTLEDNDIFGNVLSGVQIKTTGNPTLRRNRIHDNNSGVNVLEAGQGTLEDNDIFGNALSGVQILSGANPTLRRNRIHNSKEAGVLVVGGVGILEDNDVFSNALSGVVSRSGGNPIFRKNRINKNANFGVGVYKNGGGTFEDNDLTENAKGAWSVDEDSEANVKKINNKE